MLLKFWRLQLVDFAFNCNTLKLMNSYQFLTIMYIGIALE